MGNRRQSGHNLLEVVVAAFVFALLVLFASGLWAAYARAAVQSRDHLVATHLGRTVMEATVNQGYDSAVGGGPYTLNMEVELDGQVTQIPYRYTVTVNETMPGLKTVTVAVSYSYQEKTTELSFETLLAAQ
ncbi:MAG: hypothetical protein AB7S38_25550 [Vulcanimicrobiota bacterium]